MSKVISIVLEMPTGEKDKDNNPKMQKKTFIAPEIKGRMLRKAIEFRKINQNNFDEDTLDSLVSFIVKLFGDKFTIDDVYDGISVKKIVSELFRCVNEVVEQFNEAASEIPNA